MYESIGMMFSSVTDVAASPVPAGKISFYTFVNECDQ